VPVEFETRGSNPLEARRGIPVVSADAGVIDAQRIDHDENDVGAAGCCFLEILAGGRAAKSCRNEWREQQCGTGGATERSGNLT
jgi:hypothetical protein